MNNFITNDVGGIESPSIMIDPYEYSVPSEISYKISEYDIRSIVNLYGEDGINEINFFRYTDFFIVGIVLIVVVIFASRQFKKNASKPIP